jgi:hypothetical protein
MHIYRETVRVSDCCLTPSEKKSAISWRKNVALRLDDSDVLDQQA